MLKVVGNMYSSSEENFNLLCHKLESDGFIIGYQDNSLQAVILIEEDVNNIEEI